MIISPLRRRHAVDDKGRAAGPLFADHVSRTDPVHSERIAGLIADMQVQQRKFARLGVAKQKTPEFIELVSDSRPVHPLVSANANLLHRTPYDQDANARTRAEHTHTGTDHDRH